MNLTSQYIVNPKSREAYINGDASYKSIRTTSTRLRLSKKRQILNLNKKVVFRIGKVKFKMIRCPKGKFKMGDGNIFTTIERPFLLGETEVTQELFEKIMGFNPSGFQGGNYPNSKQRPVEKITWYDAVMFCNKLSEKLGKRPYYNISNVVFKEKYGKTLPNIESAKVTTNPQANGFRLPYEKEWEYAAKARTSNEYAGANDEEQLKKVAWFYEKSTHPVKGKLSNEWGFYDMSGNVGEWCYDLYDATSADRVVRGGSWVNDASGSRSANRVNTSPDGHYLNIGFRVSASLVK